jgi:phosphoribosylformylglycinamidine synthase
LDLKQEAALQSCLLQLIAEGLIDSAHDLSEGGLAVAAAESCFPQGIGARLDLTSNGAELELLLFGEEASRVLISCDPNKTATIQQMAVKSGISADLIGQTGGNSLNISVQGKPAIAAPVSELKQVWATSLEKMLHVETAEHLVPELLQKS